MSEVDEEKSDSPTRARDLETVAGRVGHIADMMANLQWRGRASLQKLASEWGVSVSTVKNYSAEASRLVTADEDEVRREITVGGLELLRRAREEGNAKSFSLMGSLLADVSGANAPKKQEITGKDGGPLHGPVIFVPAESDD